MPRSRLGAATLIALSLACSGCSPAVWWTAAGVAVVSGFPSTRYNPMYQRAYQPGVVRSVPSDHNDIRLSFVELDDNGWMRRPEQARALLAALQDLSARGNVSVIVYVHGWRHNASRRDHDVRAFEATLGYLGEKLNEPKFQDVRRDATGNPSTTVLGIYVGWRGKAAPEWWDWINWANLPVYGTFWNRKTAAGIVGRGDVRELLMHLDDLYRRINAREDRRMSLVVIGHSFGGHVVFDATHDRIESHLFRALAGTGADSARWSERFYPARGTRDRIPCRDPVEGFGDLVVLINPAIEAASYRRIDA